MGEAEIEMGVILPTNTVQNSGNKIKLAVGVVFRVAAAVACGVIKPITTNCNPSDDYLFVLCSMRTRTRHVCY